MEASPGLASLILCVKINKILNYFTMLILVMQTESNLEEKITSNIFSNNNVIQNIIADIQDVQGMLNDSQYELIAKLQDAINILEKI